MEFNKIIRGAARAANTEQDVYDILDAGFLCHIAFQHQGQTMMIPTAYGRKNDVIYIHGSSKNFMMQQLLDGQTACLSVTHVDGLVLARTLFDTSVNYRSVVLFGKATLVSDPDEKIEGMRIITENIIPGRWSEVSLGTPQQVDATMVIKIQIDSASAKVRQGGPKGDEKIEQSVWSGEVPFFTHIGTPILNGKFNDAPPLSQSVLDLQKHSMLDKKV